MAQWSPASQAQPYLAPHVQPHPQLGGKGLPPQVSAPAYHPHHPSSPAPSSPASTSRYGTLGPPPDLTERFRVKHKYLGYQKRWHKGLELRKDLELELAEKEAKVQALQDEVDLILDQIHDSDYAHLVPARDDLFSDDDGEQDLHDDGAAAREENGDDEADEPRVKDEEEDEEEAAAASRSSKGKKRSLEEDEAQRRTEIEARYGIDGSRQNVTRADPAPEPEPAPALAPAAADGPAPKRLKLTFGNGAGGGAPSASLA
ncbi:hypothetical protein JCM9279_002751 [Rhodotorula babjevae]